jgi:competence protein ComEA
MAQRNRTWAERVRLLARRYGLGERVRAAVACAVFVALLAGAGFVMARDDGVEIERGDEVSSKGEAAEEPRGQPDEAKADAKAGAPSDAPAPTVMVHVDGAVAAPGVYVLEGASPRVNDAVVRAGGLSPEADTAAVNLAAPVADGQKVHIPLVGELPEGQVAQVASPANQAPVVAQGTESSALVNINTATREELMTLNGVGEATANAIVEERERNGAFASTEDLVRVPGIGEKKLAKIAGSVCV